MASGKKNYFRHSNKARKDEKIMRLISEGSKADYFHYFALLEMCSEQEEEDKSREGVYTFHVRTLATSLYSDVRHTTRFLEGASKVELLTFHLDGNVVRVYLPNLLKYVGKYETKSSEKGSNKRKEKEIKGNESKTNESKKNNKKEIEPCFDSPIFNHPLDELVNVPRKKKATSEKFKPDLDALLDAYPNRKGETSGKKKFAKIITSQEKYDQVLLAIKNYAEDTKGKDTEFIKHFSTFASCWQDYLEIEKLQTKEQKWKEEFLRGEDQ